MENAGMDIIIKRACEVDHVGDVVLEFLLSLPYQDLSIMGLQNAHEMIAITTWYLWWERHKLVHEERVQDANQIIIGMRALIANYVMLP